MNNYKVSIIIPFYKVENHIERCLKSVLNQTYENIEIICVGSKKTDKTKDIVKKYTNNRKVKYYEQDGIGVGNARNKGIEKATGDFILFLDSDDYIFETTIQEMLSKILETKSDICCVGFRRIDDITNKIYSKEMINLGYDILNINKDVLKLSFISPSPWGKLFKKNLLKDTFFNNLPVAAEDLLFFLEIIPKAKKICFVNRILWNYSVRSDSLIFETTTDKANELAINLLKIRKKYEKNKLSEDYLKMIDFVAFLHLEISMSSRLNCNNKELKRYIKNNKKLLNDNFQYWDSNSVLDKISFKNALLRISIFFTKINLLTLLINSYKFMIKKLKVDVKW